MLNNNSNNTGIACYILLSFIALHRCYIFYWLKFVAILSEHISQHHFSNNICSLHASMSYFNISPNTSNAFTLVTRVTCGNLWLVILLSQLQLFGGTIYHTHVSKLNKYYLCSNCSTNQIFPHIFPSLHGSLFPETWQN